MKNLETVRNLKALVAQDRGERARGTLKDYSLALSAYLDYYEDQALFEEVKASKLYRNHGGEYCQLLAVMRENINRN